MTEYKSASGSTAEDLFIDLFADTFGAEKAGYLYSQYHFYDIYQNDRFADFFLESGARKIAIEIDDEASHNKSHISENKFYDDLLKQNSMIHLGWDVFRWAVRQMQIQPDTVKDELRVFIGTSPTFREAENYLPEQRGKSFDGFDLKLKEHQQQALEALEQMRLNRESIALICHATGTGKTVTAVLDAKRYGKRTLFLAHTHELVEQATQTFRDLWRNVTVGKYVESIKQPNAYVVCGSIQSVALNLERFKECRVHHGLIVHRDPVEVIDPCRTAQAAESTSSRANTVPDEEAAVSLRGGGVRYYSYIRESLVSRALYHIVSIAAAERAFCDAGVHGEGRDITRWHGY